MESRELFGLIGRLLLIIGAGAVLVSAASVASAAPDPAALAGAKRALQDGVNRMEIAAMLRARAQFAALSELDPGSAELHCWMALADWRVAPILMSQSGAERAKARPYLDDGLAQCDAALEINPRMGEAVALKAGLQGLVITLEPAQMMSLGMESEIGLKHARELEPANPRVWLLSAINTLHKPEFVGGGADKALEQLLKTQELYAAQQSGDSTAFDWGRDDAFFWAGRAAMQLKKFAQAREFFQHAVQANPDNRWALSQLEQTEKAVAEAAKPADRAPAEPAQKAVAKPTGKEKS